MSDEKNLRDAGMRYYVGDPCYVIDDARWSGITFCKDYIPRIVPGGDFEGLEPKDFCSALYHQHWLDNGRQKTEGRMDAVNVLWEEGGKTFVVEVHDSPGGDARWVFPGLTDDLGRRVSLGVDAGLLAIVPLGACSRVTNPEDYGAIFKHRPSLESWVNGDYLVEINGVMNDDGCFECEECGRRVPMYDMMDDGIGPCCYEEDEDDEWGDYE